MKFFLASFLTLLVCVSPAWSEAPTKQQLLDKIESLRLLVEALPDDDPTPTIGTPTEIAGCVLWLDPTTLSGSHSDGDPVASWSDSSGLAQSVTSPSGKRPLYRDGSDFYHGQPTVEFQDVTDQLEVASAPSLENSQVTYACVCRVEDLESNGANFWIFNKQNGSPATIGIRVENVTWGAYCRLDGSEGTARSAVESSGAAESGWVVLVLRYDGTTLELFVNGDLAASNTVGGDIDTDGGNILAIGNHPTTDAGLVGRMGPFIVYDNAISDADRQELESYLRGLYPNSEYTITGTAIAATDQRDCIVCEASKTGESVHNMLVCSNSGDITWYTSPTNDPHNWTSQGVVLSVAAARAVDALKVGSTWHVYVDNTRNDGEIAYYTGATLDALTQHASSPILTGSPGDYFRAVSVFHDSGNWTMLMDVRTTGLLGRYGYVDRWTSTDGATWTKDTVNSPVISQAGIGFEEDDITHPHVYQKTDGTFLATWSGFNDTSHHAAPHQIGLATSTDLISFSRVASQNPLLVFQHGSSAKANIFTNAPVIWHDGTNYVLYFTGKAGDGTNRIMYATRKG